MSEPEIKELVVRLRNCAEVQADECACGDITHFIHWEAAECIEALQRKFFAEQRDKDEQK